MPLLLKLLKGETILSGSNDGVVTLTTHRIRSNVGSNSDGSMTSIMLEHVSSIQLNSKSYPVLILIGIILVGTGIGIGSHYNDSFGQGFLIIVGIIVAALYFFTRQHICIISSDGGSKIIFSTANMKRDGLLEFIDKIEDAKSQKLHTLVKQEY